MAVCNPFTGSNVTSFFTEAVGRAEDMVCFSDTTAVYHGARSVGSWYTPLYPTEPRGAYFFPIALVYLPLSLLPRTR